MMYSPGVDVIVVNYRTQDDLEEFLGSFYRFKPTIPYSLTVVNNAPLQEDIKVATKWSVQDENLNHLIIEENVGYARAVNAASVYGNHECVAIFNADVILSDQAIDVCAWALMNIPDWGVLGPRQVNEQGRITAGGIFGTQASPKHRGWMAQDAGQFSDIRDDAVTVAGSAYFIKRKAWDELRRCPVFVEQFPDAMGAFGLTSHYYEETLCSYHATSHGWKNVFYGPVGVVHKWHKASPIGDPEGKWLKESREIFRGFCEAHGIPHD